MLLSSLPALYEGEGVGMLLGELQMVPLIQNCLSWVLSGVVVAAGEEDAVPLRYLVKGPS